MGRRNNTGNIHLSYLGVTSFCNLCVSDLAAFESSDYYLNINRQMHTPYSYFCALIE